MPCVDALCLVLASNITCCPDGYLCTGSADSYTCQPSSFPVVPPQLNNPALVVNSSISLPALPPLPPVKPAARGASLRQCISLHAVP